MAIVENTAFMLARESLLREDGARIAYCRRQGAAPTVAFLGGFMSDMTGTKAAALDQFCAARGQAFVRFDYFGHGASTGNFADGTIGRWKEDAMAVIDRLTEGPLILVGSSMGGWIMLLAALARKDRIKALIGIAAAPDMTEDLIRRELSPEQRAMLMRDGAVRIASEYDPQGYLITRALIEEGARHLVMAGPIALTCPIRLLHGMQDRDVPWRTSLALAEKLESPDVRVTLIKNGDHRLSSEDHLAVLRRELAAVL